MAYARAAVVWALAQPWAAGTRLLMTGLAVRLWSFAHLSKYEGLTPTGPCASTRNPACLGSLRVMSGLFLAAGNAFTVGGLLIRGRGALAVFFACDLPRQCRNESAACRRRCP